MVQKTPKQCCHVKKRKSRNNLSDFNRMGLHSGVLKISNCHMPLSPSPAPFLMPRPKVGR